MARPSKLTDKQWIEVTDRVARGESMRALSREFDVSEAAIRQRVSTHAKLIKDVANQMVSAEVAFKSLPVTSQIIAHNLADEMKQISMHLAGAAKYGAATAHRLNGIAHNQVSQIDDAEPENSTEALQRIAILTKIANGSAEIGLKLLAANKESFNPEPEEPTPTAINFVTKSAKKQDA
jgi:hypothetical protein